jgi:hypothetical protein
MKNRATIPALFNHPWMATRRDSEMDVSALLKGSIASVTHSVVHGDASKQGGKRPSIPGLDIIGEEEVIPSALLSTSPTINTTSFFGSEDTTSNIFDNMSPLLRPDATDKTIPPMSLPSLATGGSAAGDRQQTAAAQAQADIARITSRSGVVDAVRTGNQDRGHFLTGISKKTSKGALSSPGTPRKTPNSAIVAGRKTLRNSSGDESAQKVSQVSTASPTTFNTKAFKLEADATKTLTPTPPGTGKKKKFQGGPPRFGRKQTPKQTKEHKKKLV